MHVSAAFRAVPPPAARLAALLLCLAACLPAGGCVSNRFKHASNRTPPMQRLDAALGQSPAEVTLIGLITYNGPGSWKRDAYWDEFVLALRNPGANPLVVTSAVLEDFSGAPYHPGTNPWRLEQDSKTAEQRFRDAGVAFVRYTTPVVLIGGTGTLLVLNAGLFTEGAATAAGATIVAIPVYYATVLVINARNKAAMEREFHRRELRLPLSLGPGETRTGSLFFPMTPGPRMLRFQLADGEERLELPFLRGLHLDHQQHESGTKARR